MAFKIGFAVSQEGGCQENPPKPAPHPPDPPRKSVVQVYFSGRGMTLAYYNDQFDLRCGDLVYVDGKLEGLPGRVVEVSYSFKIRLADYHRVVALADTTVHGQFFMAGSHFITFDPRALPAGKAALWFRPPAREEEFASGSDEAAFPLQDLAGMGIRTEAAARGRAYYAENRVLYLSLADTRGFAIVQGTAPYEVEFTCRCGEIRDLTCSCFCPGRCKHGFAAMLQLQDILAQIEARYASRFAQSGYFAAVRKDTLFAYGIEGREEGVISL